MTYELILTGAAALVFALVHVVGPRLVSLRAVPRNAWLSLAGGVSVAYVFVLLLPELAEHQRTIDGGVGHARGWLGAIESHCGIVLNVLKEELPADRESRFVAFAAGAAGYAALLLATG